MSVKRGIIRFLCGIADSHGHDFRLKVQIADLFPDYELDRRFFDIVIGDEQGRVVAIFNLLPVQIQERHGEDLKDLIRAIEEDGHKIAVYNFYYDSRHRVVEFAPDIVFRMGDRLYRFPKDKSSDFWKTFDPESGYGEFMVD